MVSSWFLIVGFFQIRLRFGSLDKFWSHHHLISRMIPGNCQHVETLGSVLHPSFSGWQS